MCKTNSNLQNYIHYLGLPPGLYHAISKMYDAMDGRIWLIDNSYAMLKTDSHVIKASVGFERIDMQGGASRWAELSECVEFHTKMASRCWIPTQFRLLNEPGDNPYKFTVCWRRPEDVREERAHVIQSMKNVKLEVKANPLGHSIRKLIKYLAKDADEIRKKGDFVSVIICTHGIPTDKNGSYNKEVLKEFVSNLSDLSKLPVRILFRLVTDDEKVLEYYTSLDTKIDCDVLDDFWAEAMEIYLHNPWLAYGIGIHRLREAGMGTDIMDMLDEKPFTLEEIREFCVEFFLGKDLLALRNPNVDPNGFFEDLEKIISKEKLVWNPLKNKPTPWIDVEKLKLIAGRTSGGTVLSRRAFLRRATSDYVPGNNRKANLQFASSSDVFPNRRSRDLRSRSFRQDPPEAAQGGAFRASFPKASNNMKAMGASFNRDKSSTTKDLKEAIQQWSHHAPDYKKMKPLQVLLVDAPKLFPPRNPWVESHEHFFKWKEFSEDAFIGESGDSLIALLKRASRKSKLFFHPDKLPSDLTTNQDTLFKAMWDIIQESEANTL